MGEDSILELGVCTSFGSILYHSELNITSSLEISVQVSVSDQYQVSDDNITLSFSSYFQQLHLSSLFIISLFHIVDETIKYTFQS